MPNNPGPLTLAPLIDKRHNGVVAVTILIAAASSTGPPSNTARKTERRDQSICPSDRSNTRADDAVMDSATARRPATGDRAGPLMFSPDTGTRPGGCRRVT